MTYDPKTNKSKFGATDSGKCNQIAKKYNWEQPQFPEPYFEKTTDSILQVNCIYVGECEFPKGPMDLSQGGESDD